MRYLEESKITETDNRRLVARGWGEEGVGSYCLTSLGFQFYKMKRTIEMDGGGGCILL